MFRFYKGPNCCDFGMRGIIYWSHALFLIAISAKVFAKPAMIAMAGTV